MSILWSDAPAMTIQRSFALVGTSLFGLYLATRYSLKQQLQMLSIMFGIAIVLSIVFAIALPQYGIMGGVHSGDWRGIYAHKNGLGKMMVQSAMVFLLLAIDTKKKSWILWLGFGFSLILLLLSNSKGSLSNLAIVLGILPIYQILRWRYDLMIPALTGLAIGYGSFLVWFMSNTDKLLMAIDKDPTLTGRTDLWSFVWDMIEKRPWLGYGYSGFWVGWDGASAYIWRAVGWMPPNSHNGFLDLLLDLGVLGILIYLIGFVSSLLKSLTWVRIGRKFSSFWPLLYLTYLALANLSENTMLDRNSISWVLYIAVALSVLEPPETQVKTSILENREIVKDKYVY